MSNNSAIALALGMLFGVLTQPAKAHKVGEFMAVMEKGDQASKEQQIYYFNGTLDALMYASTTLIPLAGGIPKVCFPKVFPSRETFYKKFLKYVELAVQVGGMQRVANTDLDQLLYASWTKDFPCKRPVAQPAVPADGHAPGR